MSESEKIFNDLVGRLVNEKNGALSSLMQDAVDTSVMDAGNLDHARAIAKEIRRLGDTMNTLALILKTMDLPHSLVMRTVSIIRILEERRENIAEVLVERILK
jgi:hypothetical protein